MGRTLRERDPSCKRRARFQRRLKRIGRTCIRFFFFGSIVFLFPRTQSHDKATDHFLSWTSSPSKQKAHTRPLWWEVERATSMKIRLEIKRFVFVVCDLCLWRSTSILYYRPFGLTWLPNRSCVFLSIETREIAFFTPRSLKRSSCHPGARWSWSVRSASFDRVITDFLSYGKSPFLRR